MKERHDVRSTVTWGAVALLLAAATAAFAQIRMSATSPEDGATLNGPVRTLRVWFDREPDVSASTLELVGPDGALSVEGLHTMGEKDLMARVSGRMPDGSYTAKWRSAASGASEGDLVAGEWSFTIDRAGGRQELAP